MLFTPFIALPEKDLSQEEANHRAHAGQYGTAPAAHAPSGGEHRPGESAGCPSDKFGEFISYLCPILLLHFDYQFVGPSLYG